MSKTIIYFHGFKSSSESSKAKAFNGLIKTHSRKTQIIVPDIKDNILDSYAQIEDIIKSTKGDIAFVGSSLGGYYALYFAQKNNTKAVLINPAIPPLEGFDIYLGKNENYDTGNKFLITKDDINFLRSLSYNKIKYPANIMILVESGDEILDYKKTISYFSGSYISIAYGGDHSFSSFSHKFNQIQLFLDLN